MTKRKSKKKSTKRPVNNHFQSSKKLRYMSLFSGIGGFEVGIHNIFPNAKCVGFSEVDKYAIQVYQQHFLNHPYLGPVENIKGKYDAFGRTTGRRGTNVPPAEPRAPPEPIDLLVGGSPCQDLSSNNNNKRGLQGTKSRLFFEFLRVLKLKKPKYFILENVGSMKKKDKDTISKYLKVKPILLNSNLVSAQNRKRYYWTNIPQTKNEYFLSKIRSIYLKDILIKDRKKHNLETLTIDKNSNIFKSFLKFNSSGYFPRSSIDSKKSNTISTQRHWILNPKTNKYRKIHPIEAERLQTFPDNWTSSLSYTQRIKTLGNAVTCNVISMIMYNLI